MTEKNFTNNYKIFNTKMTQAMLSKNAYRMKIIFPYLTYFIFGLFIASMISFLVYTGKTVNNLENKISNAYGSEDSYYRELSYQACVISLLSVLTFCVVYQTFKKLI